MSTARKSLSIATLIGLILALGGVFVVMLLLGGFSSQQTDQAALLGFGAAWLLAGVVVGIVKWGERRPFTTIGFKPISWKTTGLALLLGLLLSFTVPLLTLLANRIIPAGAEGSIEAAAGSISIPILLLSILTAGVTEEILYRGYPLERLTELTGSRWTAASISLIAFTLPHLSGWNLAHIVGVVLPLGAALTAIYFWRRDLLFNMIVHTMIDLPLLFIALGS